MDSAPTCRFCLQYVKINIFIVKENLARLAENKNEKKNLKIKAFLGKKKSFMHIRTMHVPFMTIIKF